MNAMPPWTAGMIPVDMDGAALLLSVSKERLADLILRRPDCYEPRGRRKKVFYPPHIKKLQYLLNPPSARSPLEVTRNHVAANIDASAIDDLERFLTDDLTGHVYIIRCNDRVKTGFTNNWAGRLRILKTSCPYPVTVVVVMPGHRTLERFLHIGFESLRRHGEWFEEAGDLKDLISAIEALNT